ncbi:hemerythrin domain-containing protein [Variovorax sp. RCC_210]|uniref:hemerythrin domain-containing protein n=1 Tax=Variovorax sp. RCC_210 TaxID=3239217 RepID=UPI000D5E7319
MPTCRRAEADACILLDTHHCGVKKLFQACEQLTHSRASFVAQEKRRLTNKIGTELTVHAPIEEEIFHAALDRAIKKADLFDAAEVEHASAMDRIVQIQEAAERESEFVVKARAASGSGLVAMREQVAARKV